MMTDPFEDFINNLNMNDFNPDQDMTVEELVEHLEHFKQIFLRGTPENTQFLAELGSMVTGYAAVLALGLTGPLLFAATVPEAVQKIVYLAFYLGYMLGEEHYGRENTDSD